MVYLRFKRKDRGGGYSGGEADGGDVGRGCGRRLRREEARAVVRGSGAGCGSKAAACSGEAEAKRGTGGEQLRRQRRGDLRLRRDMGGGERGARGSGF